MPGLNYKKEVIHKLKPGLGQTIRPVGKPMRMKQFRIGAKLYHFTGMMTKNCRRLGESTVSEVVPIKLQFVGPPAYGQLNIYTYTGYNWKLLNASEMQQLAKDDGFRLLEQFMDFFIDTYKFQHTGDCKDFNIIKWADFVPAGEG